MLVGLIVATGISGALIARTARYRIWPIVGAVLAGGGMYGASLLGVATRTLNLAVALVLSIVMREQSLSEQMREVAAGKAEVAEY